MAAQELEAKIKVDTTELEASYAKIKALEEERAARAVILTENTLRVRKKALAEEQKVLETLLATDSKNAEGQADLNKQREESIKKIQQLKGEVAALAPATEKVTAAQEQLGKTMRRVQATLRGFAVTAAIAFGAAILKGVIDFAKGLFEGSKAAQAINAAMEQFVIESGKALGNMREQLTELKKLTPGTLAWKNEIEKVNKQYGDLIKLDVDSTLAEIEAAEKLLTIAVRAQVKEEVRRESLRKVFADAESARQSLAIQEQHGAPDFVLEGLRSIADQAERTAQEVEKALEPSAFDRQVQEAEARAKRNAEIQDKLTKKQEELAKRNADRGKAQNEKAIEDEKQTALQIEQLEISLIAEEYARKIEQLKFDADRDKEAVAARILSKEQEADALRLIEERLQADIAEIVKSGSIELLSVAKKLEPKFKNIDYLLSNAIEASKDAFDNIVDGAEAAQERIDSINDIASEFSQAASSFSKLYDTLTAKDRAFAEAEIERINKTIEGEEAREKAILNVEKNLARETAKFAVLAKAAALFEIFASQATSIANVVEMATKVGANTASPALFIVTLVAGLATTIANFANAKSILEGAPLPAFEKGTSATQKGWAVVGERGPEIIKTGKGDAVFNNQAVRTERGLIDAINDGTINDLIMKQYVYPAIMAHQIAQKSHDRQELKETVKAYFDNAFDDRNLLQRGDRQISLLKGIYSRLKPKQTPAPRSRF